jgi:predicted transcriptional regulator
MTMRLKISKPLLPHNHYNHDHHSHNFINRDNIDFERQLLQVLIDKGPQPTSRFIWYIETNHDKVEQVIKSLVDLDLVQEIDSNMESVRVLQLHPFVKKVIAITDKGRRYVEMLNSINSMIQWPKRDRKLRRRTCQSPTLWEPEERD